MSTRMAVMIAMTVSLVVAGCSGDPKPVAQDVATATPAAAATPDSQEAPKQKATTDAMARLDALAADTQRKEAEYQESLRIASEKAAAAALVIPVYTEVAPPPRSAAASDPLATGAASDTRGESYWRDRRRAFDAKFHEDQAASKAAFDLFVLMGKTGIMRKDPGEYVKAMNEMKRTEAVVADDIKRVLPDLYAEAARAGVPRAWVDPPEP
jgi:hypothetical protein